MKSDDKGQIEEALGRRRDDGFDPPPSRNVHAFGGTDRPHDGA
jgi:hypothetical protein